MVAAEAGRPPSKWPTGPPADDLPPPKQPVGLLPGETTGASPSPFHRVSRVRLIRLHSGRSQLWRTFWSCQLSHWRSSSVLQTDRPVCAGRRHAPRARPSRGPWSPRPLKRTWLRRALPLLRHAVSPSHILGVPPSPHFISLPVFAGDTVSSTCLVLLAVCFPPADCSP